MNICFISENGHYGEVPNRYRNARTEFCWQKILNAYHVPIDIALKPDFREYYDLIILIPPKKRNLINNIDKIKSLGETLAIMQEGAHWFFQDYSAKDQLDHYKILHEADFLLCHNNDDQRYYQGLLDKNTYIFPTLMLEEFMPELKDENRSSVILGGNFCSYYRGFDSYIIAKIFKQQIIAPSTGRKPSDESSIDDINHIPHFIDWYDWIQLLNNFKYAVHLNASGLAGTFALNCARLGIPCLGYKNTNTQRICHPYTTFEVGDLKSARSVAIQLKLDEGFYNDCVEMARKKYEEQFSEKVWLDNWNDICKSEGLI